MLNNFVLYMVFYLLPFDTVYILNFHNSSGMSTSYDNGSTPHEKIRSSTIFSSATKYYKEHYNFFSNASMASETFISWIQLLTLFSAGIVLADLILSNFIFGTRPYSFEYFVGNTLFGIIAFICLPLWFHIKRKRLNLSKANISEPSTPIAAIGYVSLLVYLVCSYMSYASESNYWWCMTPLFFLHVVVVLLDTNKNLSCNFQYVILYCTVMLRTPDFLGHTVMRYHDMIELHFTESSEYHTTMQTFKVLFSLIFLVVMTLYVVVLKIVVQRMSTKHTSSRFLYVGQLYYYMFWYLLIVEEKPTDWTFWAMLLLQNLNYILMNTGVYEDLNSLLLYIYDMYASSTKKKRGQNKRVSDMSRRTGEVDHEKGDVMNTQSTSIKTRNRGYRSTNPEEDQVRNKMEELQYRVQVAENDHLADTTALIVVVSTTILWVVLGEKDVLAKEFKHKIIVDDVEDGVGGFGEVKMIEEHQKIALGNLLLRFLCTFGCRLVSQRISHLVFALKERCLERSSKAHLKQSLATASPKISRRRGRDSLANLQFGEAKEIVHEDDEFSLNQPKKNKFQW